MKRPILFSLSTAVVLTGFAITPAERAAHPVPLGLPAATPLSTAAFAEGAPPSPARIAGWQGEMATERDPGPVLGDQIGKPAPRRSQRSPKGIVASAPHPTGPRVPLREGVFRVARHGSGLVYSKGYLSGAPVHVVQADLRDPDVKVGVVVARGGIGRYESFLSLVNRTTPGAAITGTFFGLRNGLPTGDLVVNGRAIFRGFIGTALAITDGNVVSFISTGYNEETHWELFDTVLRGGPRLIQAGMMAVNPSEEGFRSLAGDAYRSRTAVGITADRKLLLVTIKTGVTLRRLAMVMRALGAYHAVALDGGSSTAMSFGGRVVAQPGRGLTNLLVVYADRDRYERAREHFYYQARRRVLPSGLPEFGLEDPAEPAAVDGGGAGEPGLAAPVTPSTGPGPGAGSQPESEPTNPAPG